MTHYLSLISYDSFIIQHNHKTKKKYLGIESFGELKDASVFEFPDSDSDEEDENTKEPESKTLFKNFIYTLTEDRPHAAPLQIIR